MKFYRVHYRTRFGGSEGYEWFTSGVEAERAVRRHPVDDGDQNESSFQVVEIDRSKYGLLAALNKYGGHPDNG